MSISESTETTTLINRLLDAVKTKNNLGNEYALALHLGKPQIYLIRWRKGEYGEAALKTLAPLLVEYAPDLQRVA